MNNDPWTDGAKSLIELLRKRAQLAAKVDDLRPKISELQREMRLVDEEWAKTNEAVLKLLRSLDVDRPGNHGWENRLGYLLEEMQTQVKLEHVLRFEICPHDKLKKDCVACRGDRA